MFYLLLSLFCLWMSQNFHFQIHFGAIWKNLNLLRYHLKKLSKLATLKWNPLPMGSQDQPVLLPHLWFLPILCLQFLNSINQSPLSKLKLSPFRWFPKMFYCFYSSDSFYSPVLLLKLWISNLWKNCYSII